MCGFVFRFLFGFSFVMFPCNGVLTSLPDGTILTFVNGSTQTLNWTFSDPISKVKFRQWTFTSSDGSPTEDLATILNDGDPVLSTTSSLLFAIEKPGALILKNINITYNGTYQFSLAATGGGGLSNVIVFITAKPNVTINCSSPLIVNEGADVICECKCKDGNPPANCAWYKNGAQIGESGIEAKILFLRNFNGQDRGSYTCVGQSHVKARDEKSIRVTDFYKPVNTAIGFSTKKLQVEIGESVTITCTSEGFPEPRFTIFHNDTKAVSTERTYTICKVKWVDAGTYECFAKNELGNDSAFANFTIQKLQKPIAKTLPTQPSVNTNITRPTLRTSDGSENGASEDLSKSGGTEWYIIVISLVSGIIIGILLSYIVLYTRRKWFTSAERSPEVQVTTVDSTYQELDLTKINKEDNYQSLKGNAARNDGVNNDESNYTELNKTRDDENNYQSLK